MRHCRAVWYCNAPLHQRCIRCWGMSNGRWRIYQVGWEIKWRTGWNASINGGCVCGGAFGLCRILLSACAREGSFSQHIPRCACSSGVDGCGEQAKFVRKKGQPNIDQTTKIARWGAVPGVGIFWPCQRGDAYLGGGTIQRWEGRFVWHTPRFRNICVILTRGARSESACQNFCWRWE